MWAPQYICVAVLLVFCFSFCSKGKNARVTGKSGAGEGGGKGVKKKEGILHFSHSFAVIVIFSFRSPKVQKPSLEKPVIFVSIAIYIYIYAYIYIKKTKTRILKRTNKSKEGFNINCSGPSGWIPTLPQVPTGRPYENILGSVSALLLLQHHLHPLAFCIGVAGTRPLLSKQLQTRGAENTSCVCVCVCRVADVRVLMCVVYWLAHCMVRRGEEEGGSCSSPCPKSQGTICVLRGGCEGRPTP